MRRTFTLAIGLMLVVTSTGVSQTRPVPADKVDAYVKTEMQMQHIPGLALLVIRDGKIIKAKGYGVANLEHNVPVKPETIFQSGSVGKQFTATGVMMLVEEGRVALDEKVGKYLPDTPETWNDITVRHLLSHTAGLGDYPRDFDFRKDYTEDQLLKAIYGAPRAFKAGEKWSYSNLGYVTLGILIGKVTGKFYGDFLQERIFKPLGMTSTRIINETDIIPNRANGYRLVKGALKNQEWVSPAMNTTADGSLYFNIVDLAKWDAALYTEKLLKKSSLDLMWTPIKLNDGKPNPSNYGFGWAHSRVKGHNLIEHGGAWQGFTSHIARYVDDKLAVVALANLSSGAGSNPGKIAHHVAGLYVNGLMPEESKPIEDKEPEVTALLRAQLQKIADGKPAPEAFTDEAQKEFFPERIKGFGEQLKEFGALKSFVLLERRDEIVRRVYRYRAQYENGPALVYTFHLAKENKIARLNIGLE